MWHHLFNPDVLLYVILFGFALFGWWMGVIHAIGSLVGVVAGAFAASHYNQQATDWFLSHVNFPEGVAHVIVFFLTFFLVNRAVGFVFWIIDKSLDFARFVPFIKSVNRMLGAIFGFVEGVLVLGLGIAYLSAFPFGAGVAEFFADSTVAPWLVDSARLLYPLFPEAWDKVQGLFEDPIAAPTVPTELPDININIPIELPVPE